MVKDRAFLGESFRRQRPQHVAVAFDQNAHAFDFRPGALDAALRHAQAGGDGRFQTSGGGRPPLDQGAHRRVADAVDLAGGEARHRFAFD